MGLGWLWLSEVVMQSSLCNPPKPLGVGEGQWGQLWHILGNGTQHRWHLSPPHPPGSLWAGPDPVVCIAIINGPEHQPRYAESGRW